MTDFNNHCLPMLYDGPSRIEDSFYLIKLLRQNNITRIFFTPDFHLSTDTITSFMARRKAAFASIRNKIPPDIRARCAARVLLEEFSMSQDSIRRLSVKGSNYIFVELPIIYDSRWIEQEIHSMLYKRKLKPIFNSFQRVIMNYPPEVVTRLTNISGAAFQLDMNCVYDRKMLNFIRISLKRGKIILIGTHKFDVSLSHGFDILSEFLGKDLFEFMNEQADNFLK